MYLPLLRFQCVSLYVSLEDTMTNIQIKIEWSWICRILDMVWWCVPQPDLCCLVTQPRDISIKWLSLCSWSMVKTAVYRCDWQLWKTTWDQNKRMFSFLNISVFSHFGWRLHYVGRCHEYRKKGVCVCSTANAILYLLLIQLVIIHHSKGSQHSGVFLLVYQLQHVSLPTKHSE